MGTAPRDATDCPAWALLKESAAQAGAASIAQMQLGDVRFPGNRLVSGAGLTLDITRQRVNSEILQRFGQLADELSLRMRIEAM
jgi:hypothetical protein